MPIYEYECLKCKKQYEVMQKITEGPLTECSICGGKLRKKISNTTFVLKGTGWYATDYASNNRTSEKKGNGAKTAEPSKSGKKTGTETEQKSEAKETVTPK
ncbi:MAG: FmdB family zinc ribbon protein [Nitrospirota bacterium]|nr:FmdB family zinc ribbon protein [Nitrospirota bacterium]